MKKSVAYDHFPQVVPQNNRFWLYNRILKKRYENRPEERVRLKWVEYLLHQTDWKKSRIGFETPVKLRQRKNTLRADLVLYSDSMRPVILVECKSNSVKLNHSVAEQAARYNSEVHADHLVLTNGVEDYWFEQTGDQIGQTSNILNQHTSFSEIERDADYWTKRGFFSTHGSTELGDWLTQALNFFWSDQVTGERQYLDFRTSVLPVPMNQYYKLVEIDSERRLAISFLGTGSSESFIVGILNTSGVNKGILSINLDQLHCGGKDAVTIFRGDSRKTFSSEKTFGFTYSEFDPAEIKNLPENIIKFF